MSGDPRERLMPPLVWRQRAPARQGDPLDDIDTPALVLDLDVFEANLLAVQQAVTGAGLSLRPHAKAHKVPEIAVRQQVAGAVGVCCQKVSEAEVFVAAGIRDVLVANEVVGARKLSRLAALARTARIAVCVDHPGQVDALADAVRLAGTRVEVLIEIDVGQQRCGVADAAAALALARAIRDRGPDLVLRGLQAYHGRAQHVRTPAQRAEAIASASRLAAAIRDALVGDGHPCAVVTGGGTGTYHLEIDSGVFTEVQPGSYVLMDADYAANEVDPRAPALGQALSVLATVMSVQAGHVVLDAGLKALSTDSGPPVSMEPGWRVGSLSDEHATLMSSGSGRSLALGDRVRLIPGHCDPTVNLHDWMLAVRKERVEAVWPVAARGAVF